MFCRHLSLWSDLPRCPHRATIHPSRHTLEHRQHNTSYNPTPKSPLAYHFQINAQFYLKYKVMLLNTSFVETKTSPHHMSLMLGYMSQVKFVRLHFSVYPFGTNIHCMKIQLYLFRKHFVLNSLFWTIIC